MARTVDTIATLGKLAELHAKEEALVTKLRGAGVGETAIARTMKSSPQAIAKRFPQPTARRTTPAGVGRSAAAGVGRATATRARAPRKAAGQTRKTAARAR